MMAYSITRALQSTGGIGTSDLTTLGTIYPRATARSCGRLPSRRAPFGVTTTVSPQVQIDLPSAVTADGLQMKTIFSLSATASCFGLRAWLVMIGPSSP